MILSPGDRRRCYTAEQVCALLQMAPRTFRTLRAAGKLPMLEELRPRLGKHARYRADLVDRYLANQFEQRRSTFGVARAR